MGKLLVAYFISVLAVLSSFAGRTSASDSVFICTGGYARTYHTDRSCSGLEECGQVVRKVHRSAVPKKRRLCKLCAKADAKASDASLKSKKKASVRRSARKSKKERRRSYQLRDPLDIPIVDPLSEPCE